MRHDRIFFRKVVQSDSSRRRFNYWLKWLKPLWKSITSARFIQTSTRLLIAIFYKLAALLFLIFATEESSFASSRFTGSLGYTAATVNSGAGNLTEDPYGFSFAYDQILSARSSFGFEHLRTLTRDQGTWSTAVALTGLRYKYYPIMPIAPINRGDDTSKVSFIKTRNLSPYVGLGTGFAQSSLRDRIGGVQARGTAGVYFAVYAGLELPVSGPVGVSFDLMISNQVFGSGEVQTQSGLLSIFIYF